MKTKPIFACFVALFFSVVSLNAAGLLSESDLLIFPDKVEKRPAVCPVVATAAQMQLHKPTKQTQNEVLVQLFDATGELVTAKKVSMAEFMDSHFTRKHLPEGSTFVMYHQHTAYYQTNSKG